MTGSAAQRLSANDGKWKGKVAFKALQSLLCALSIACAVFVLTRQSKFQSQHWRADHAVLYYIPAVGALIVFNLFFIAYQFRKGEYWTLMYTSMIYFLFAFVFMAMGCYETIVVVKAYQKIGTDLYGEALKKGGSITAMDGSQILITDKTVPNCPAFKDCNAQNAWVDMARTRAVIALVGAMLVDAIFVLLLIQFFWSTGDSVFGTRPKGWKKQMKADLEKAAVEAKPKTPPSAHSDATLLQSTANSTSPSPPLAAQGQSSLSLSTYASNNSSHASIPNGVYIPNNPNNPCPPSFRGVRGSSATLVSMSRHSGVPRIQTTITENGVMQHAISDPLSSARSSLTVPHPEYMQRSSSAPNLHAHELDVNSSSSSLQHQQQQEQQQQQQQQPPPPQQQQQSQQQSQPQPRPQAEPIQHPPALLTGPIFGTPPPGSANESPRSSYGSAYSNRASQQSQTSSMAPSIEPEPGPAASRQSWKSKPPLRKSLLRNMESYHAN